MPAALNQRFHGSYGSVQSLLSFRSIAGFRPKQHVGGQMEDRSEFRKSACELWILCGLPFPAIALATDMGVWVVNLLTILKVFSSSLICWASMGVRRLQVAISPRRSYSPLGQVSWKMMRGLKLMFRLMLRGVPGTLLESPLAKF